MAATSPENIVLHKSLPSQLSASSTLQLISNVGRKHLFSQQWYLLMSVSLVGCTAMWSPRDRCCRKMSHQITRAQAEHTSEPACTPDTWAKEAVVPGPAHTPRLKDLVILNTSLSSKELNDARKI